MIVITVSLSTACEDCEESAIEIDTDFALMVPGTPDISVEGTKYRLPGGHQTTTTGVTYDDKVESPANLPKETPRNTALKPFGSTDTLERSQDYPTFSGAREHAGRHGTDRPFIRSCNHNVQLATFLQDTHCLIVRGG